ERAADAAGAAARPGWQGSLPRVAPPGPCARGDLRPGSDPGADPPGGEGAGEGAVHRALHDHGRGAGGLRPGRRADPHPAEGRGLPPRHRSADARRLPAHRRAQPRDGAGADRVRGRGGRLARHGRDARGGAELRRGEHPGGDPRGRERASGRPGNPAGGRATGGRRVRGRRGGAGDRHQLGERGPGRYRRPARRRPARRRGAGDGGAWRRECRADGRQHRRRAGAGL
ncbi:MAG: LSU ribosomal protein L25p, partial [uncultured Sphingomonadaceae bacterium]